MSDSQTPLDDSSVPEDAPLPERVGSYLIERELGSGGMGTVYLARHEETGKVAAVKVLPASMAREPGFVARFNREITALETVHSPHIVELYEHGEHDGIIFYAMEYVPGETMADRLRREKRIDWRETIEIGIQICRALKAAHNCGVIHRDLKPSNLLIHEDGTVKLSDFGIAQVFATSKLTVTGGILGTAEYMSPEQAQGKRVVKQSDLYSLGALLYVMLTGRPPFVGKTPLDIAQKHRFAQFDSPKRVVPSVPHWLDEIVCKCLSKRVEDRYPDAYVLSLRLQEVPRKVDLQQSGDDSEGNDSGRDTQTETAIGVDADAEYIGGTIVRDLVRDDLQRQRDESLWNRVFDNTWTLIGMLIVLIGLGYLLWKVNHMTPEDRFAEGVALMGRPPGAAWDLARRDYFEELLEEDPERWRAEVEPYLERIELYELESGLRGKAGTRESGLQNGPEAILGEILELKDRGHIIEARQKLHALQPLIAGNASYRSLYELVQRLDKDLQQRTAGERLRFVSEALDRAEQLVTEDRIHQARQIWRGVVELYHADPDAADFVSQAAARLKEFPADAE